MSLATSMRPALMAPLHAGAGRPHPALAWNFRRMGALPDRIVFSRAAASWHRDPTGTLVEAASGNPVFDHDDGGKALGLRIEGQRTNLCPNNGNLAALSKGNGTTVALQPSAAGPDGLTGAVYRVVFPAGPNSFMRFAESVAAGTYTVSVWIKSNGPNTTFQTFANGGGAGYSPFMTAGPQWQRFEQVHSPTSSGDVGLNNGDDSYASDILVWRPQVELASFASSLIETAGSTAARAADDASLPLASLDGFRGDVGTWLVDWIGKGGVATDSRVFELNDGSAANQINLSRVGANLAYNVVTGGGFAASVVAGAWSGGRHRAAFRYAANDFAVSLDGSEAVADASGAVPALSSLLLGRSIAAGWSFSTVVGLAYWPVPLDDSALRALSVAP